MDDGVWRCIFGRVACAPAGFELTRPDVRDAAGNLLSWRKLTRRITRTKVDVRLLAFRNDVYDPTVRVYRDDGVATYTLCAARTCTRLANLVLSRYVRPLSQFTVWLVDVTAAETAVDGSTDQQSRFVRAQRSRVLYAPKSSTPTAHSAMPWW